MSTLGKSGYGSGCGGTCGHVGVPLQLGHEEEPCLRECLTSSKVGIAIYQSKALFKAYHRLA